MIGQMGTGTVGSGPGQIPHIGVGLLGYAFMGKAHSHAFKTMAYMMSPPPAIPRLVAICGRDEAAVRDAAARYGYETYYTDWRALVADDRVQLFDNGGPNHLHAEPCIAAAAAGKHVLCEKPLARTAAEAQRMLDAVTRAGVKHMVAFNYRFVPAIRQARDLIAAGALGEIRHFRARYLQDWLTDPTVPRTWRLEREAAGSGAIGDLGSHIVDLARFLIGEPRRVTATVKTFVGERPLPGATAPAPVEVDDAFAAVVEFAGGAVGTLEASRVAAGRRNHLALEINGTAGSISFDLERLNELEVYWTGEGRNETRGFRRVLVTDREHPFLSHWWPPGHILGWEHTFVHEIYHFLAAIVAGAPVGPNGATFEDGYRAALVCDAILESARTNHSVEVAS